MGLFSFIWRLFSGSSRPVTSDHSGISDADFTASKASTGYAQLKQKPAKTYTRLKNIKLKGFRRNQLKKKNIRFQKEFFKRVEPPYVFARQSIIETGYYNLSLDAKPEKLQKFGLPVLTTPAELAEWLNIPIGKLAWLVDRFTEYGKPVDLKEAHYHYRWLRKRKKGYRLLEIPKKSLREVQDKILTDILQLIPPHPAAKGFHPGSSIRSNAAPHVNKELLIKYDLDNFYPRMRFSRVIAVFRTIGFSREVSIWLARLCTSATPFSLSTPSDVSVGILVPYTSRHLPQGAPTSPALANLCAYSLDVRLAGMAKKFNITYTRYADDLTFSADGSFKTRLRIFLPLVERIIKLERYTLNLEKRRVVRSSQRQVVTGIVVNEKLNCPRRYFDRVKAILHNCVKSGPESQNRDKHPHFQQFLLGSIAHIKHVNPQKGNKLSEIFNKIRWDEKVEKQ